MRPHSYTLHDEQLRSVAWYEMVFFGHPHHIKVDHKVEIRPIQLHFFFLPKRKVFDMLI